MRFGRTWMAVAAAAALGVVAGACGDDDDENGGGDTGVFATQVQPILSSRCTPCHATEWGSANVETAYTAARDKVTPNEPGSSDILVYGNGGGTPAHPAGDQLSDAETTTITGWINAGAPRN